MHLSMFKVGGLSTSRQNRNAFVWEEDYTDKDHSEYRIKTSSTDFNVNSGDAIWPCMSRK